MNSDTIDITNQQPSNEPSSDDKNMALLAHLSGFIAASMGMSFIGPLVIYLWKKDESEYVKEHARKALNFQITYYIYFIVSGIMIFILIGILTTAIVGVLWIVGMIMGAVKAANGEDVKLPLNINFIKS